MDIRLRVLFKCLDSVHRHLKAHFLVILPPDRSLYTNEKIVMNIEYMYGYYITCLPYSEEREYDI